MKNRLQRWRERNQDNPEYWKRKRESDLKYRLRGRDDAEWRKKQLDRNRKWLENSEKGREILRSSVRSWKVRNPEKVRAHYAVRYAISVGKLIRPKICDCCGCIPTPRKDGLSGLHAHHEDYSKPLDVVWLCAFCHGNERRKS